MGELDRGERRARKRHLCGNCYQDIPRGSIYRFHVYKQDGVIHRWKTHHDCDEAAMSYAAENQLIDPWDGIPPLWELVSESRADFEDWCSDYRGYYPHVVCRMELNMQLHDIRVEKRNADFAKKRAQALLKKREEELLRQYREADAILI